MARLSVSLSDEQKEWIGRKVEGGRESEDSSSSHSSSSNGKDDDDDDRYESKSAVVRECIQRYERVEELEAQVSDLQRQLREANSRNDDVDELATYVETERELQREERERRRAPLLQRLKWVVWGYDE